MGVLDLPDEPDEPRQVEYADTGGQDRPTSKPREMSDPDERGRVYDAMRAHASAEAGDAAEPALHPDETVKPSYWDSVPELGGRWADHEKRWPENRQPAVDYSDDPYGSYRSDAGFYLSPERHTEAVAAIGRVRNVEPTMSADVQRVEQENRHGGWLEGFGNRLKDDDRLKEKVAAQLAIEPDKLPTEVLRKIPDAIRFTFCFESRNYTNGCYDIKATMESYGYEMYYSRNSWINPEYKGINTRWTTTEGQRFEIQFHTPESYHAKQYVTHEAYERIRNPLTSDEERRELEGFQREVSSRIEIPEDATDIPDFKKEGF